MITAKLKSIIVEPLTHGVLFVIKLTGLSFSDGGGNSTFLGLYVQLSLFLVLFCLLFSLKHNDLIHLFSRQCSFFLF